MTAHLGPAASSFLDGALDATRRDEVLAHLAHCAACRAELTVQRGLRASLRDLPGPCPPADLSARLLAVAGSASSGTAPAARTVRRRRPRRGVRRVAVGGTLLALGLGGTLAVAGPPPPGPVAPVDPTSAQFVREHSSISTEIPFGDMDVVSASLGAFR